VASGVPFAEMSIRQRMAEERRLIYELDVMRAYGVR
jgi:hypothetical protein